MANSRDELEGEGNKVVPERIWEHKENGTQQKPNIYTGNHKVNSIQLNWKRGYHDDMYLFHPLEKHPDIRVGRSRKEGRRRIDKEGREGCMDQAQPLAKAHP